MISFSFRHKLIAAFQDIDIIGIRKLGHILPKILIPKPTKIVTLQTLYGFYLEIDPVRDNGVEHSLYYTGTYEKGTLSIIQALLKEGDTFIDIGANIGLMSIFAATIVKDSGKVISFEPNPNTRAILERNIKTNKINHIEVSPFAIGQKEEKSKIYDRWDANRGSASLIKPEVETDSYDIEVTTLSSYISTGQAIHLIKIDVEGYELDALKGSAEILSRKNPPMLIVECSGVRENTFGTDTGVMYEMIKAANKYRVFKSSGGKIRSSKLVEITTASELPGHDNIYCFTEAHLQQIPKSLFK